LASSIGTKRASNDDIDRHRILQDANDDGDGIDEDVSGTNDLGDMILLLSASASIALLLSSMVLGVMIRHADMLIRLALLFNVVCSGAVSFLPVARDRLQVRDLSATRPTYACSIFLLRYLPSPPPIHTHTHTHRVITIIERRRSKQNE
jgi:hypothetical protein